MSAFRNLAPSTSNDQSSGSSPNPTKQGALFADSTSGTSGGASGGASGGSGGAVGGGSSGGDSTRRRRNAGNVSLMACTECRHARQKCDGVRPDPCNRCLTRRLGCVYEPHTKTHKDDLIREIENLRGDNSNLQGQNKEMAEAATSLEHQNRDLQETSDWQRIILDTIGSNGHDGEIIMRLRAGESHQSIADWLCQQHPISSNLSIVPPSERSLIDVVRNLERHYQEEDGLNRTGGGPGLGEIQWTKVSSSQILIGHLFDLYFTWVHPVHMLLSELDFKHSFRSNDTTYCSVPLVNAICAMGCHLLESDRIDTMRGDIDATTLREGFMNEARASLSPETYHQMTSIQSFAVMYLVDVSSGEARRAIGYLRSALDYLKTTQGDNQSDEARELSEWGIRTLNTYVQRYTCNNCAKVDLTSWRSTCASITYQRLYAPEVPRTAVFHHVRMDGDDAVWRFYRQVGDERELPKRPSHAIVTACRQAGLFRIIDESLNLYCGHRGTVTAKTVLECYKRYLEWRDELPARIRNIDVDDQPLPHVLYLHIQYHTALVQHFTPLLHCNHFKGSDWEELRRMIVFHARSGIEILEHSRRLYSSRYQMPLMSFCTLHLGDALVRHSPKEPPAPQVVHFCLGIMQQTRTGFAICGPLQELFRRTAVECGVDLPDSIDSIMGPVAHYTVDDILDACTRLSYTQPFDQILRHIYECIAEDWQSEWRRIIIAPGGAPRRQSSSGKYLQINSLLNN